jgi:hypothetical protein
MAIPPGPTALPPLPPPPLPPKKKKTDLTREFFSKLAENVFKEKIEKMFNLS